MRMIHWYGIIKYFVFGEWEQVCVEYRIFLMMVKQGVSVFGSLDFVVWCGLRQIVLGQLLLLFSIVVFLGKGELCKYKGILEKRCEVDCFRIEGMWNNGI